MKRATTILVVVAILGLAALPSAWAEDDEKLGNSPAEQAYRDAWWAETSAGALDRALDGYRRAVDAEGPAAVRAQALYRMGVVLERIGKTDDAIRALERLAKEFPDQTDLQAKARDRLEEWTAVDLRTNFREWYERYKYSPEFQGRIVELVLKLGAPVEETASAKQAAEELLTIGQASVPALEAHLDSSNENLRGRAVDLLLRLGTYPHARHLLETDDWGKMSHGWGALLAAPPEIRTRLLAELDATGAEGSTAESLQAVLGGPENWPRAIELTANSRLVRAILEMNPGESVLASLRELVPTLDASIASSLAHYLLAGEHVPTSVALGWLELPDVGSQVVRRIQSGELADARTWPALVDAMNALPIDDAAQRMLFRAFMRSLSDASADEDLGPAVLAYERVAPSGNVRISTNLTSATGSHLGPSGMLDDIDAVSRFLAQIVDEARDPRVAHDAMQAWARIHRGDEDVSGRLIEWALGKTSPAVSQPAAKLAGSLATDATLDHLLRALGKSTVGVNQELLDGLRKNRMLGSLTWGDERYLRLNAFARAASESRAQKTLVTHLNLLFQELHKVPARIDQTTRLALKVPRRVWIGIARNIDKAALPFFNRPEYLANVRVEIQKRLPHWPLEDRIAALRFFDQLPAPVFDDEELQAFLRAELGRQWSVKGDAKNEALERDGKKRILRLLPEVGLDEMRQVFDLSTAEGALAAWGTHRLPFTADVYEALSAARTAEDYDDRYGFLNHWMRAAEGELELRAARELATDREEHLRRVGIERLTHHRLAEDIRLFEKALVDPEARVRYVAAEALAGVYDQAAIRSLAKALDDPDPDVRDRVLKTLETIKEIEEKKNYWKKFAAGVR